MGSIAGFISVPFMQPYSTSKFALKALSEGLRNELINQNIFVSLIEMGPFDTAIWEKSIGNSRKYLEGNSTYSYEAKQFEKFIFKNEKHFAELKNIDKQILHAITAKKPHKEYFLYKNKLLNFLIFKTSPKYIVNWVFKKIFKK